MPHRLALGFIGRNGTYPANQPGGTRLLIAVGARFDDRSSSSWIPGTPGTSPLPAVHVDIDPSEIWPQYPVEVGILADAKVFLAQLSPRRNRGIAAGSRCARWNEMIQGWRQVEAFTSPHFDVGGSPLRPERVVKEVRQALPDDAIISLDSGVHHNWFMQFWRRGVRRPCSTHGASRPWASESAASSAPSSPHHTGPAWQSSATAGSS